MRLVHVTLRSVRSLAGQTDWPISSLDLMREGRPPDVVWEHSGFLARYIHLHNVDVNAVHYYRSSSRKALTSLHGEH